jgi:hypothetical protein
MSILGRNDICYCGSGKKYKKCCLDKDTQQSLTIVSKPLEEPIYNWEPEEENNFEDDILFDDESSEEETTTVEISDSITSRPYPVISFEERKLVDVWWDTYERLKKPDDIRNHLQVFMNASPHLVENLQLEHEVLFELGADYLQEGRLEDYILLLLKVRNEFPATYIRSAGDYDADIIAWLICNNRINEIAHYLTYFAEYPVDFVDQVFDTIYLLIATDNTSLLPVLISKIGNQVISSPEVIAGDGIFSPLLVHILSKYLREDYSEADITRFTEELSKVIPHELATPHTSVAFWKNWFENIFRPFESWPEKIPSKESQLTSRYFDIGRNFMRYLHESIGISWISAKYYSDLLIEYLIEGMETKKGKTRKQFDFSKAKIDSVIAQVAHNFLSLNCTKTLSILNTIWYFAGYLQTCGNLDETQKSIIQTDCAALYNSIYPDLKKHFAEASCFQNFPLWEEK